MSAPTPPKNLKTTQDKVAWLKTLSQADREAFHGTRIADSAWSNAFEALNNPEQYAKQPDDHRAKGKVPEMPANLTPEQQTAWLAGLSPDDLNAFIKATDNKDEGKGILGGALNHTIFSGFNNPQGSDQVLSAAKGIKSQREDAKKNNQPDPTAALAAPTVAAPDGAGSIKSNTDLLTDPVKSAFSAAQLDTDFQVDTGQTTSAYRGTDLQSGVPVQASAQDRLSSLYSMPADQLKGLQEQLSKAGYLGKFSPGVVGDDTMQGYLHLLVDVAKQNKMGNQVSPEDLLAQAAEKAPGNTQTHTQIDFSQPLVAKALIHTAMTSALGRPPNPGELLNFTQALTAAEQGNPTTSTTTTNPDGSTATETSGGLNESAFAADYVQQHHGRDIGTFNAATTLYDAALSVLGAGGRGA